MKRVIGIILLISLVGISAVSAQEGIPTTVNASVRFRSGPSTEWRIITILEPGATIHIDARDGTGNFWIRGAITSGEIGWVASESTNLTADQLNSLPIKLKDDPFGGSIPAAGAPAPAAEEAPVEVASAEQPAAAIPDTPIQSLAPIGGFGYGGHVNGFDAISIQYMQRAGMTWAKKQIRYWDGMPASDVSWMIGDSHAKGYRLLLGVVGYPAQLSNPGYADRYASFVGELAAAGVDAIEVWNEPNIDREWPSGQISPANYTNFLAVAYNGIKARNRSTLVISGAPAPTGFFGGCSLVGCDDIHFIAGMRDAGAARYMDCLGIHYNEGILPPTARSGDPRGNSGYYTRYFQPMMETYTNAFGSSVPLCFTELGYLSPEGLGPLPPGFDWAGNVTAAQQGAWLSQAVSMARNSGRVRLLIIWNVDYKDYGADPVAGYAIIRPDLSCPACDALGG